MYSPSDDEFTLLCERFDAKRVEHNLKRSKKREIILRLLFETPLTLSVEEIYQEALKKYPQIYIGKTTIYRTLWFLEECEMVSSVVLHNKGVRYQLKRELYSMYLICNQCHEILQLNDHVIQKRQIEVVNFLNYIPKSATLKIYGICPQCCLV